MRISDVIQNKTRHQEDLGRKWIVPVMGRSNVYYARFNTVVHTQEYLYIQNMDAIST